MGSRLGVLAILCSLTASCAPAQHAAAPAENLSARVDALFQKMDTKVTPGCALAVVKDGRILYQRGYGMADLDHNVPITPATVFHVASMSKQFTAASIVLLAQQGKLSLDDPVRKYVPELPDFGVPITIRQLIHHTSGLRDQWDLLGLAGWRYSLDLITDEDVLAVMVRQRDLNFPPGSRHLYSNTGYTLLAQIVKRVSGQSFREFTTSHIFEPLQMSNTHFRDDHAEVVKDIAYGYQPAKDAFLISITNFDTVGATSLLTTVRDLALWDENFYHPRVGGAKMIEQLQQRGRLNNGEQLDYAFGLVIGAYRGLPTVDHAGGDAGYRSDMIRFPQQHFSAECLCNSAGADPSQLTRKVAEIYLGKEMKPAEAARVENQSGVHLTAEQLRSKAGTYLNAENEDVVRITVKGDKLQAGWGTGEESYDMKAVGDNHFRLLIAPVDLTFEASQPGGSLQLLVNDGGGKPNVFAAVAPFSPAASDLKNYAGIYSSEEIDPLYELKAEPAGLVLYRLKNKPDVLQPITRDLFSGSLGNIRFTRNPQGEISGFMLSNGRIQNFRFEKGRPAIPSS